MFMRQFLKHKIMPFPFSSHYSASGRSTEELQYSGCQCGGLPRPYTETLQPVCKRCNNDILYIVVL